MIDPRQIGDLQIVREWHCSKWDEAMRSQPIFACLVKTDYETDKVNQASIVVAQRLASLTKTTLDICVGTIEILVPTLIAPVSIEDMVASENSRRKNSADAVCKVAEHARNPAMPQQKCAVAFGDLSEVTRTLLRRSRCHGFVVTETGIAADMLEFDVIQKLLFESGRPVLVVPRDFKSEFSLKNVLIAWDGGENAARAVWNAVHLLTYSERVVICCVKGEKSIESDAGAEELAESLRSMGIGAEVLFLDLKKATVSEELLLNADKLSTDLIVLGAYGHSRWREFVFGGVTREMLKTSKIPMLMSN